MEVGDILIDAYYCFQHSVKSIDVLKEFAEFCDVKFFFKEILNHCETKWLSMVTLLLLSLTGTIFSYFFMSSTNISYFDSNCSIFMIFIVIDDIIF